ncbi:hypothetical protein ACOMHN_048120 [Nucella lapillus]
MKRFGTQHTLPVFLTWLHLAWRFLCCHGLPIDQIIVNSMTSPDGHQSVMSHESSQTVRVELDMVFSLQDWMNLMALNSSHVRRRRLYKRQAIWEGTAGKYWPGGVVYYDIDRYVFEEDEIRILHEAMHEWMRNTCIQFRPASRYTRNKLRFVDGDGCSSNVGMVYNNRVTLAKGCRKKGVVVHELGHALGFHHEQTRPDRDDYVKIHRENIPVHMHYNFRKYTWTVIRNLGVPYDYLSIMHYGKSAFSANGEVTIETIDKKYQDLIGNRRGLSFRDIKSANALYNCKPLRGDCHLEDTDCPGEGFVSKDCVCWCPTHDVYREIPYYICQPGTVGEVAGPAAGSGEVCKDHYKDCKAWASRGECSSNKAYMQAYCQRACGFCTPAVTSSCDDDYEECEFWRHKGYCEATSYFRRFMAANCKLSCGVCLPPPMPGIKIVPCERTCGDDHHHCRMWAWRGECTTTPDYMLRHCRKTCNMCCTADGTDHQSRRGGKPSRPPRPPASLLQTRRGKTAATTVDLQQRRRRPWRGSSAGERGRGDNHAGVSVTEEHAHYGA